MRAQPRHDAPTATRAATLRDTFAAVEQHDARARPRPLPRRSGLHCCFHQRRSRRRATFSADILRFAILIRPGHLVLIVEGVVVYRGPLATAGTDLDAVREQSIAEWQALTARHVITEDTRRIVADGYNRIAERYAQWSCDEVVDQT